MTEEAARLVIKQHKRRYGELINRGVHVECKFPSMCMSYYYVFGCFVCSIWCFVEGEAVHSGGN